MNAVQAAQRRRRDRRVVRLVLAGASYRDAAAAVGLRSPASVHQIMEKALVGETRRGLLASEAGAMFVERGEAVIRANWAAAMRGDYQASTMVLRIMDEQARVYRVYERATARQAGENRYLTGN